MSGRGSAFGIFVTLAIICFGIAAVAAFIGITDSSGCSAQADAICIREMEGRSDLGIIFALCGVGFMIGGAGIAGMRETRAAAPFPPPVPPVPPVPPGPWAGPGQQMPQQPTQPQPQAQPQQSEGGPQFRPPAP